MCMVPLIVCNVLLIIICAVLGVLFITNSERKSNDSKCKDYIFIVDDCEYDVRLTREQYEGVKACVNKHSFASGENKIKICKSKIK